jgi:hypothetical protein
MRHGMGVDVRLRGRDEARAHLRRAASSTRALRSEKLDADDGSVLVLSKRALGAFPLPRPKLRVTIEEVAEATPWTP